MTLAAPDLLTALDQRVHAVSGVLGLPDVPDDPHGSGGAVAAHLLPRLLERCRTSRSLAETWLVSVAATAALPHADDVRQLARAIRHQHVQDVARDLLGEVIDQRHRGHPELEMDVVVDGVVVDVDFCARHEYNSGIQRVVRRTLPRWVGEGHGFTPTAWTKSRDAARTLSEVEWQRVFAHRDTEAEDQSSPPPSTHAAARLVVPWRSAVVLIEVPVGTICRSLAAVAELSGNRLSCVAHDTIPVANAHLRPAEETEAFAGYLSALKHAQRVVGVSESAAAEFSGFGSALSAQGLPGPEVTSVVEPVEAVASRMAADARRPGPVRILLMGAREPHKNHRAAIQAAERLWREGLDFEVTVVGGSGWHSDELDQVMAELVDHGRPLRLLGRVSDQELDAAYRDADAAVFVSLHEGFGLPAAEALASGTPVLVSDFGSLAEIASGGGALTADPRNDDEVTGRLRDLVVDAPLRQRLAGDARGRPQRTWDQFAAELWTALVGEPS